MERYFWLDHMAREQKKIEDKTPKNINALAKKNSKRVGLPELSVENHSPSKKRRKTKSAMIQSIDPKLEQMCIVPGLYTMAEIEAMKATLNCEWLTTRKPGRSITPVSFDSDMSAQAPDLLRARDPSNDMEIRNIVSKFGETEKPTYEVEPPSDPFQQFWDYDDDEPFEALPFLLTPICIQSDTGRQWSDMECIIHNEMPCAVVDRGTQVSMSSEPQPDAPAQDNPMDLSKPEELIDSRLNDEEMDIDSPDYEEHLPKELQQQNYNESLNRNRKENIKLHIRKDLQIESFGQVTCSEEDLIKTSTVDTTRISAICDNMITSTISTGDSPDTDRLHDEEYEFARQRANPNRIAERRKTYVSDHFNRDNPS